MITWVLVSCSSIIYYMYVYMYMYILLPYAYIQHLYISWQHLSVIESLRVLIALCFHLMSHLYFFMWSYTFGVFIMQSLSHLTVIFSLFNFFVLNNQANHNHFSVWYIYLQRKGSMNCEIQNPHPMGLGKSSAILKNRLF